MYGEVHCFDCHTRVYEFTQEMTHGEIIQAEHLRPVDDRLKQPSAGDLFTCPECGGHYAYAIIDGQHHSIGGR